MSKNTVADKNEMEKNGNEVPPYLRVFENDDPRLKMDILNEYFTITTDKSLSEEEKTKRLEESAERLRKASEGR